MEVHVGSASDDHVEYTDICMWRFSQAGGTKSSANLKGNMGRTPHRFSVRAETFFHGNRPALLIEIFYISISLDIWGLFSAIGLEGGGADLLFFYVSSFTRHVDKDRNTHGEKGMLLPFYFGRARLGESQTTRPPTRNGVIRE